MSFGAELRAARQAAELSLAELARLAHFSKGYLSKVENGIAPPNQPLAALCDSVLKTDGRLSALIPNAARRSRTRLPPARLVGLPVTTAHFTGRVKEMTDICAFLGVEADASGPHTPICAIHGMAGVGKTALAVRAATRMEAHFADGCLFLNLRGHQPDSAPVSTAAALDRLLAMLGADGATIPVAVEDRAAHYRDLLRGRRFLLVFDNVRNTEQVRPLLPAEPRCRVLVTSRSRLIALDDAEHVSLDTLDAAAAAALFTSVAGVGQLDTGSSRLVAEIANRCGRLPLAIRIAAARYRGSPAWTLQQFRDRLADGAVLLDELDDGERSVAAAFRLSYDGMPEQRRRLFGLLALHPGADVDIAAAAALASTTSHQVERAVEPLLDAHLLTQHAPRRYRFHDLIRAFASSTAIAELSVQERDAAVDRLLEHYLHAADLADRQITPNRHRQPLGIAATPPTAPDFEGPEAATAWIQEELSNIVAACGLAESTGRHRRCWQLALALGGYFFLVKPWEAWTETHELGLRSAIATGDRWAEGTVRNRLGLLRIELGDLEGASAHYQRALSLFRDLQDVHGEMTALANDAWVHHYQGAHQRALRDLRTAYAAYRHSEYRRNAAITLRGIGLIAAEAGERAAAIRDLEQSLQEFNELDLPLDATMALNNLGNVYELTGDHTSAAPHYRQAIVLGRACGSRFEEARAEVGLGSVAAATHDVASAREHWTSALAYYRALRAPQAVEVERRLAELDRQPSQAGHTPPMPCL